MNKDNSTQFSEEYYRVNQILAQLSKESRERLWVLISKRLEEARINLSEVIEESLEKMRAKTPTPDIVKVHYEMYKRNNEIAENELKQKATMEALKKEQAMKTTEEVLKNENHYISSKRVAEIKQQKEEDELMKKIESISDIDDILKKVELDQEKRAEINKKIA